ncbi:MAG: ABC transporter substrate-binding protein [Bdellovibrionota bacterium]
MPRTLIFVLLLTQTNFSYSAINTPELVIGYGSSDAVLPQKSQELWYRGFRLGYEKFAKKPHRVIEKHIITGEKLGAIEAANFLIQNNASLIIGFPTSHEALLTSQVVNKKTSIVSIYAGAGHAKLGSFGSNILTTGESMDLSVSTVVDFIVHTLKFKKGVVISNPHAVFSVNQVENLKQNLKDYLGKSKLDLTHVEMDKKQTISSTDLVKIKNADFIWMTQYADESSIIMSQLEQNKIDKPIITNSSWSTGDIEFIRRFLVNKKTPTYSFALWLPHTRASLEFNSLIKQIYNQSPTSEIAYGYDIGVITAELSNRVRKYPNLKTFKAALNFNRCFNNTSVGKICFPITGGHASRKITPTIFSRNEFKEIPD